MLIFLQSSNTKHKVVLWEIRTGQDGYPSPNHISKAAELVETHQRRIEAGTCTVVSLYVSNYFIIDAEFLWLGHKSINHRFRDFNKCSCIY